MTPEVQETYNQLSKLTALWNKYKAQLNKEYSSYADSQRLIKEMEARYEQPFSAVRAISQKAKLMAIKEMKEAD